MYSTSGCWCEDSTGTSTPRIKNVANEQLDTPSQASWMSDGGWSCTSQTAGRDLAVARLQHRAVPGREKAGRRMIFTSPTWPTGFMPSH